MPEPLRPLAGVTVLAWEQAVALPVATRLLADLGATVIRLESHQRTRPRPRYLGNDLARNKLSLAIDLRAEEGRRLVRELLSGVDCFCENFTPRVKRQFGLTEAELRPGRERLIMLSLSGYGQTGAWSERPTYGPGIEAAAGLAWSMGYEGTPPTRPGTVVYADTITGYYAAFALLAALRRRRATGRGASIDLSMYEANAFHLGLAIAASSLSGQPQARLGNADPEAALQGVYGTREPERWLAVTLRAGQEAALAALLGSAADVPALDAALAVWAAARDVEEAAARLRAQGIAAAPVLDARGVLLDPQLRARAAFAPIQHERPLNGYAAHPHLAMPWLVAGRPRPPLREAPAVGQDTRAILHERLGLDTARIDALVEQGVIGVAGPAPAVASTRTDPRRVQQQLAWRIAAGFDPTPERTLGLLPLDEEAAVERA